METLEAQIEGVAETLDGMMTRSKHPDEWAALNNMHLSIMELKEELFELREIEKRNLKMKGAL